MVKKTEKLFFWGENQFLQTKKVFPEIEEKSLVTGSPVFDYYKVLNHNIDNNSSNRKKKILIATSFPFPNHKLGPNHAREMTKNCSGTSATEEHLNEIFLDADLQDYVYPKFRKMVAKLAEATPECEIILRPHPTENIRPWKDISDKVNNVTLQFGGEITNHIIENDIFIHFNSTTSIEACFYNKKVITYIPNVHEKLFKRLSPHVLSVSEICTEIDSVIDVVKEALKENTIQNNKLPIAEIANGSLNNDCSYSSQKIVEGLKELKSFNSNMNLPSPYQMFFSKEKTKMQFKNFILYCLGHIDHHTNLFSAKYAWAKDFYKASRAKQGNFDNEEVQSKISNIFDCIEVNKENIQIEKKFEFYIFENNK